MTCIVGLVDGSNVWVGADGLTTAGCDCVPADEQNWKVFRRGEMLLGVTGSMRMAQILCHLVEIPAHSDELSTSEYLVTQLMPAIKRAVAEHDGARINDPSDTWECLLGYRGALYSICHDLCVNRLPKYGAAGCGSRVALGSLYTTDPLTFESIDPPYLNAETRLRLSLSAAAEHDIHVAPPFVLESI